MRMDRSAVALIAALALPAHVAMAATPTAVGAALVLDGDAAIGRSPMPGSCRTSWSVARSRT